MDPITTAIVAALSTGAISGLTEVTKTAIGDAYGRLKELLSRKFGNDSDVLHAVEQVETKPDSAGRKTTMQEEIAAVKADQDQDVLQAAQALLQLIHALPGGEQHSQTATGNYIAQADRGSSASVNVGSPKER
jgi:Het-E N-terminal domain